MSTAIQINNREHDPIEEVRALADQAFSRAVGALLVEGNHVRLLKDARENYPASLDAIGAAKRHIHFESYIIHEDDTGRKFADALIGKSREGVRVRFIYDWVAASVRPLAVSGIAYVQAASKCVAITRHTWTRPWAGSVVITVRCKRVPA
jgi:phosphatidylserine/phosphatidylglycerophosphate/cardiolipin synthase-like enzyme